jgi:ribulose-phosphate 3-epimerase
MEQLNKYKMSGKISASMMCSNLIDLKETLKLFEDEGVEYLHIDMMDGTFVPNFGLGVDYIRGLRELTSIPLDLHLMIKDPEYKFQWIGIKETDIVSIHYESTFQVQRALDYLQPFGCKRFLAINPATPVYVLEEVLDYIDGINLLMVNPGFAGQKIVPSTMKKAEKVMHLLKEMHHEEVVVEVDGNISYENAAKLRKIGASIFVAGSSSVFRGDVCGYGNNIKKLREVTL